MPVKDSDNGEALALRDQALELVHARRRGEDPDGDQLREFAARSDDHAGAVRAAERFLALSQHIDGNRYRGADPCARRVQLLAARASDHGGSLATAAVAVLLMVFLGWGVIRKEPLPSPSAQPISASTTEQFVSPRREQQMVTLSDGSTVWLDWDSRLEVEFDAEHRRVNLVRGEAAFDVVSDASRPFSVESFGVRTQVTGTEFVVNARAVERVEVSVLEGEVHVESAGDTSVAVVKAEQVIRVMNGTLGDVAYRSAVEIGRWRDGMLVFENRPLIDVLHAIEPYSSFRLDTTSISAHPGRVSGVFFPEKADDALFTLLETHRIDRDVSGPKVLRLY